MSAHRRGSGRARRRRGGERKPRATTAISPPSGGEFRQPRARLRAGERALAPHGRTQASGSCAPMWRACCTKMPHRRRRCPVARQPACSADAEFSALAGAIEMMPGDALQLTDGPDGIYVVTRVEEGDVRRIEARRHEPAAPLAAMSGSAERSSSATVSAGFSPIVHLMDLPRFDGSDAASFARAACFCRPFRRMLLSSSARSRVPGTAPSSGRPLSGAHRVCRAGHPAASTGRARWNSICFLGRCPPPLRPPSCPGQPPRMFFRERGMEVLAFAERKRLRPIAGGFRRCCGARRTEDAMVAGAAAGAAWCFWTWVSCRWAFRPRSAASGSIGWSNHLDQAWTRRAAAVRRGAAGRDAACSVHARAWRTTAGVHLTWVRRSRMEQTTGRERDCASTSPMSATVGDPRRRDGSARGRDVATALRLCGAPTSSPISACRRAPLRPPAADGRAVPQGTALTTDVIVQQEGDA